jgi:DNA-binding NarL/FixJ family response regulator
MAAPIRIVIADDHTLFRQGLKSMLRLQPEIAVVAEVGRAGEVMPAIARTPCDILLLDLQMDRSALSDVAGLAERIKVIVVTATERVEDALGAIRAGARGVVFKRFAIETLMMAIGAVMDGHVWMPPALQAEMTAHLHEPQGVVLTRREREIVRHVALGLRNAEVAERLGITEVTVKTHLNNVFQKLRLRDRVELALYAVRTGIIGIHERRL